MFLNANPQAVYSSQITIQQLCFLSARPFVLCQFTRKRKRKWESLFSWASSHATCFICSGLFQCLTPLHFSSQVVFTDLLPWCEYDKYTQWTVQRKSHLSCSEIYYRKSKYVLRTVKNMTEEVTVLHKCQTLDYVSTHVITCGFVGLSEPNIQVLGYLSKACFNLLKKLKETELLDKQQNHEKKSPIDFFASCGHSPSIRLTHTVTQKKPMKEHTMAYKDANLNHSVLMKAVSSWLSVNK